MQENIPLAPFTTFGIGGPARYFCEINNEQELPDLVIFAKQKNLPLFILSGGSGVLVSDEGFPGLVIKINNKGIMKKGEILEVSAGEVWHDVVTYAVENNLQGIECLVGVPGLTGAAAAQNIGCYGQEIPEVIQKVRVFDIKSLKFKEFTNKQCGYTYRDSLFRKDKNFIITKVWLKLHKNKKPTQTYANVKDLVNPSLKDVYTKILKTRKALSTLYDLNDVDSHGTGSFFIHPLVDEHKFKELQSANPTMPFYKEETLYKIPAGWLVEHFAFPKGYNYKNTGLSTKHALVIVNKGGATSAQVLEFAGIIQEKIKKSLDIDLKAEVIII